VEGLRRAVGNRQLSRYAIGIRDIECDCGGFPWIVSLEQSPVSRSPNLVEGTVSLAAKLKFECAVELKT
jgi:hypothetical protein